MFKLKNKVAVITGGASGIGRAVAETFAKQGATVCILDQNPTSSEEVVAGIIKSHQLAEAFYCNITHQLDVRKIIDNIIGRFHKIDILVNSAGIAQVATLEKTSEEDFEKIFQVNVKGTYNAMHSVIPQMKRQKHGVILNLASVASSVGIPDRFAYSMSKGAVVGMTLSVARDYLKAGIRCNCISPGRVHTPFVDDFIKKNYPGKEKEMFKKLSATQPLGRMAKPQEIAWLVLYLCSDEAAFITGCDYPIDGGSIKLNT